MSDLPDNPYPTGSLAHRAWKTVAAIYYDKGKIAAEIAAADVDRNLNIGLEQRVRSWPSQ